MRQRFSAQRRPRRQQRLKDSGSGGAGQWQWQAWQCQCGGAGGHRRQVVAAHAPPAPRRGEKASNVEGRLPSTEAMAASPRPRNASSEVWLSHAACYEREMEGPECSPGISTSGRLCCRGAPQEGMQPRRKSPRAGLVRRRAIFPTKKEKTGRNDRVPVWQLGWNVNAPRGNV